MSLKISLFNGDSASESGKIQSIFEASTLEQLSPHITENMWAPGTFSDGRRALSTFLSMDIFVADVDGGCTIEEARRALSSFECLIGTSRNHQLPKNGKPPCDRFRILIPLAESITSDTDFKATWFQFQKLLPAIDPACKDASRFYYPCREVVASWTGQKLEVTKHVEKEPEAQLPVASSQKLTPSKRTLKFLAMGAPEGMWHSELVAACLDLKQQRWSQEEAEAKLETITGHLDDHDESVIDDVWANRDPRHPPRGESEEAVARLIKRCHLMQNLSNISDYVFVDREKGETHNIDIRRAQSVLKTEWKDYMKTKKLDVLFTYNPYAKPLEPSTEGILIYNTYRPADWRRDEFWFGRAVPKLNQPPEIYDRFFTHLTAEHAASKEYLLDWMAHSLRARNFTILTAIGNQGVGKGILAEIFRHLHGASNYSQPKDDVFKERFNSPLKDKTLINVDEISLKTKEEHDRLKAVVNDWIAIEEKGCDAVNRKNYANFYISSNHLDAIQIEPGDRRFSIIQLASKKIIETDLRSHIDYLTSPEGVSELGLYLLYRPVTHNMLEPFRSPRFEEVRLAGLHDWELYFVEEFCPQHAGKTYPISFVLEDIKSTLELKALGRRRILELQKKFPEKFRVLQDPKNRSKRIIVVSEQQLH